ncbi:hypothetical protein ACFCWG_13690 [Streptomyces sp. NPDC056390]|uniref:hypothetical protein n=1 Tax=Streptomyces sp. NPDC056390 TaxID=3345806 RepID=UPI0035DDAC15
MAITKDGKDRRRKLVTMTDAGRELATALAPAVVGISEEMPAHSHPVERDRFLCLMRRAVEAANQ